MNTLWRILFYQIQENSNPVQELIESQNEHVYSKILHLLNLLQVHGNMLRMPYSKQLENNLYVLRVRGKTEIRIFYCFKKQDVYLLHIFQKKTQKTPQREIELAIKRRLNLTHT